MSKPFEKIAREPAYRTVATAIRDRILSGEIEIGQVLPAEGDLAEMLGVNRLTIREGIRQLEQTGLVTRKGGKKLFASVPKLNNVADNMTSALVMHKVTFLELWEVMCVLEPLAADNAAAKQDEELLDKLEKNIIQTEHALADETSLVSLDVEFHRLIAEMSANNALLLARAPLSKLFYPAFYRVISHLNAGERLLVAHKNIFEAIKQGNNEVAKEWMVKHIVDFRRGYQLAELDIHEVVNMSATTTSSP